MKKPLYGLDDASRKFWLKFKETLIALELMVMPGDKAFYCLHKDEKLKRAVLTHDDDLILAENEDFRDKIKEGIIHIFVSIYGGEG